MKIIRISNCLTCPYHFIKKNITKYKKVYCKQTGRCLGKYKKEFLMQRFTKINFDKDCPLQDEGAIINTRYDIFN